jgi:hypothetical protein
VPAGSSALSMPNFRPIRRNLAPDLAVGGRQRLEMLLCVAWYHIGRLAVPRRLQYIIWNVWKERNKRIFQKVHDLYWDGPHRTWGH